MADLMGQHNKSTNKKRILSQYKRQIKEQNQLNTKLYGIRNSTWKNQGLFTSFQNNRIPGVPLWWRKPNGGPPPFRLQHTTERERTPHRQDLKRRQLAEKQKNNW
jgi:hypothetical protein